MNQRITNSTISGMAQNLIGNMEQPKPFEVIIVEFLFLLLLMVLVYF
jgi:hypothetical protein